VRDPQQHVDKLNPVFHNFLDNYFDKRDSLSGPFATLFNKSYLHFSTPIDLSQTIHEELNALESSLNKLDLHVSVCIHFKTRAKTKNN